MFVVRLVNVPISLPYFSVVCCWNCDEGLMFRVAAGEDLVARLGCLPNVAGVPAGSLGGATGFCYLSGGGRRLVAVVAAPLLLSLVVFLRLESGWDVWFDLTVD